MAGGQAGVHEARMEQMKIRELRSVNDLKVIVRAIVIVIVIVMGWGR